MKNIYVRLILFVTVLAGLIVFVPLKALVLWATPLPRTVQAQLQKLDQHFRGGIVVYVDIAGRKPQLFAGRGRKTGAVNPNGLFKIASISKLYMAAATAKLIARDKLKLEKSLAEYLPETIGRIENAEDISLRLLVQHRSGIPDFIDSPHLSWGNLPEDVNVYLSLVLDKPADFKPDAKYRYSNTNYLLLGKILDQALGYNHQHFIRKELLAPLNLHHTYGTLDHVDNVLSGYFEGYEGDLKTQDYRVPGGSMLATAEDVGVFVRALNTGGLLSEKEEVIYATLYPYEHTGLLPGYSSIVRYHKEMDAVVVLLVGSSGGKTWSEVEVLYSRLVKILRKAD